MTRGSGERAASWPGPQPPGLGRDALLEAAAVHLRHLDVGVAVVVACSAGQDSTALAAIVDEARQDLELVLVHVDHGLRSESARAADRAAITELGTMLGREALVVRAAVGEAGGPEAAARAARYDALHAVVRERSAEALLVAHTADDQAETVLLRLARGAGPDGARGMRPWTRVDGVPRGRPLLDVRRADVHRFVAGDGLPWHHDATNDDDEARRNRARRELMPALERLAPDPVGALGRFAALLADDVDALQGAAAALPDVHVRIADLHLLHVRRLQAAPVALARRVVRDVWRTLTGASPEASTVSRVLGVRGTSALTLPGAVRVRADHGWLALEAAGGAGAAASEGSPSAAAVAAPTEHAAAVRELPLTSAGRWTWPPLQVALQVDVADGVDRAVEGQIALALPDTWRPPRVAATAALHIPGLRPEAATLVLPELTATPTLRAPRPGDRIATGAGRRRLVEVFRDAGVPRALRPRWPVLCLDDVPVWVPGLAQDPELAQAGRVAPRSALAVVPDDAGSSPPSSGGQGEAASN